MQCEKVREQFADYVIDNLQEPARTQIAQHLMTCEGCRVETRELTALWTTLGTIPAAPPGPELRARFDVMLEAYQHGLEQAPRERPSQRWWQSVNSWLTAWWPRQPALQFGLALALLVLGVMVGRQLRFTPVVPLAPPSTEIAELRSELSDMRRMVAISLMQQQSASDRIQGVNWSYQLKQPGSEVLAALLDTLTHDPNVNVRLATVDALRQFGDQPVVRRGVIDAMAKQESPMVQIALIDLAVDLREKESIDTLRQLTQDQKLNEAVRQRAEKGLAEIGVMQ